MEIKKTVAHFAYKIEEKPGGGFIAQPLDPANEPLEAPTREELMQKVQAKSVAELERELPELLNAGGLEGKLANLLVSKTGLKGALKIDITTTRPDGVTKSMSTNLANTGAMPASVSSPPLISGDGAPDRTGTILRIIAALVALGAIVYFMLR